jgi:hypothetical protein
MRQAFRIFRKDIRRFWYTIFCIVLLTGAFAWFDAQHSPLVNEDTAAGAVFVLLPLAWLLLIVSSIHEECLIGDGQDWLTRPYSRPSILAAKLMLIAAAVFLPLFAADVFILWRQGFAPFADPAGLLGRYTALAFFLILPAIALGTVTASIAQATIVCLALPAAAIIYTAMLHGAAFESWGALQWVRSLVAVTVLSAGALAIVILQYRYRTARTARSLGVLTFVAALLLPALLPWTVAHAVQSRLLRNKMDPAVINVSVVGTGFSPAYSTLPDTVLVDLELSLSGMGRGVSAWIQRASARCKTNRAEWTQPAFFRTWDVMKPRLSLVLNQTALAEPIQVELTIFFILSKDGVVTRMPLGAADQPVPGVGICTHHASTTDLVICRSPWRSPGSARARLEPGGPLALLGQFHSSPFPTLPAISPLRFETAVLGTRFTASSHVAIAALQASASFERQVRTTIAPLADSR